MSSDNKHIKKFGDFNMDKSYYRMLNLLVVSGEYKPGFFSPRTKFEIKIYYTPMKGKIMEIIPDKIGPSFYTFKRGDNISDVREWVKKNNYEIVIDKKKI